MDIGGTVKKLLAAALIVVLPACVATTPGPNAAARKPVPDDLVMAVLTSTQGSVQSSISGPMPPTPLLVLGRVTDEFPANLIPVVRKYSITRI
jgi:hypothetical protein